MYCTRSMASMAAPSKRVRLLSRGCKGCRTVAAGCTFRAAPTSRTSMHSHSHSHGGGHSHDESYPDDDWNLYSHVERAEALNGIIVGDGVTTIRNEEIDSTGKATCVMKPHARRLDLVRALSSDADEQLIVKLQFNVPVSVRKIMIVGAGPSDSHPNSVRCYTGRAAEDLDFSGLEGVTPAQVADLAVNASGEGYFNTVRAPFTNITALALFFPSNHGDEEQTKISYIGMQGEHTHGQRMAVHAQCASAAKPHCPCIDPVALPPHRPPTNPLAQI